MPESRGPRRSSSYGIGRVDDDKKSMHCWVVHIERKRRVWHRSFSDGVCGGKAKALHAARAFRDEVLVSHSPMTRAENASIRRSNNRSGVPGVLRQASVETTAAGPVERAYWIAYWTKPDGKRSIRKFSIRKYGEKDAFKRAKAARKQALAEMDVPHTTSRGLKNWLRRHDAVSAK
jgi:hypothetical protein